MATYQDLSAFDWSSIIPAQQPQQQPIPQQQQQQQPQQQPVKLVKPDEEWFNRLLLNEQQQSQAATSGTTTGVNTASASPLEFSSLFDLQEREYDEESLFSNSNLTSLDNSPLIKAEDYSQSLFIPKLDLQNSNFQLQQQPEQAERNLSTSSSSTSLSDSEQQGGVSSTAAGDKKPKKKRAPRKRLTPHQKQAHNKIEKRYRININAKIAGLQQIIPWVSNEKTAFETGEGVKPEINDDAVPKLNKSMILEKATSYILHLQENERIMNEKVMLLRNKVMELGGDVSNM